MEASFFRAVVQNHIKTTRKRNDELVQTFVRVAAALGSAGNVVKIINALDLEGYMLPAFNEGKIASRIADLGEVNNLAFS